MSARRLVFHYDFASPFTYFAHELLDSALRGLDVAVEPVPTYLRGFEAFASGIPFSPAKTVYLARDAQRIAERHAIPFGFPADFPVNGLHALRAALALAADPRIDEVRRELFRAVWARGESIATADAVASIVARLGLDRDAVLAGMGDPAIKERLRQNTDQARERGAFGVPTFFVGDEMFFGHDRLEYVRAALER